MDQDTSYEPMLNVVRQEWTELRYNRKHIDQKIRKEILSNTFMIGKIDEGVQAIKDYMSKTYSYKSKNARVAQLKPLNIRELVIDIYVGISYCQTPELFTSITGELAGRLKFSDKADSIKTVAELVAVLCSTDAFDILKMNKYASLVIVSRIPISEELVGFIENTQYLPPMVCEPRQLINNYSSGYLTHDDSLILGPHNHHNGDICIDVLNTMNQVKLKLCTEFLCKVSEDPTFTLDTPDKRNQWKKHKEISYRFYSLIAEQDNQFHLTHKVDKRGRIYSQGYHINPQGTAFKKAMIELHKEEYIDGVFI